MIRDVGASGKIRMLLYGDPGVGKTTLIGSGGKKFKTLLIRPNVDHADPIIGSGVKETLVRDWTEMLDVLEYLRHEGDKWDWVWLDSISLFQDVGLDDMFAAAVEAKPSRADHGPDRPEYRVNMWRLEQFIRHAVGAELFNFGVTAHPFWFTMQSHESPEEAYEKLMPWIQGKSMPTKISGYMNVVGFMEVMGNKEDPNRRVIHTRANQRWFAKDQYNAFGSGDIVNPTMPGIVKAIEATRGGPSRRGRGNGRTPIAAGRSSGRTRREQ